MLADDELVNFKGKWMTYGELKDYIEDCRKHDACPFCGRRFIALAENQNWVFKMCGCSFYRYLAEHKEHNLRVRCDSILIDDLLLKQRVQRARELWEKRRRERILAEFDEALKMLRMVV